MPTLMSDFFDLWNPFLWLASSSAILWGVYGYKVSQEKPPPKEETSPHKWMYQVWFNAVGGFVGWLAFYYLLNADLHEPKIAHLIELAVAFYGITGNLPQISLARGTK